MLQVIYREAAELDLKEAYLWYEEREGGLGSEFMRCIDGCIQLICRHPGIYPFTHKNIRQAVIRRFLYSIFYLLEGEAIIIISVFHSSRRPGRWERTQPIK